MSSSLLATVVPAEAGTSSFHVPLWAWIALGVVIIAMLTIDLLKHREAHEPTTREALLESSIWVACALVFAGVLFVAFGGEAFSEYMSGYLIEKSLSIDNVFVWSMLFATLAIPVKYQHRVLFWGIFGALALRGAFIALGSALIMRFWWILVIFGVFLAYTGIKMLRHRDGGGETKTRGAGLLRRIMPVSDELDGQHFLTRINGKRAATPLLVALIVVETTDIIFAVDSVPAILAISDEPFIVFSSNVFAILGLRAMYFLLAGARERLHYLPLALGGLLVFIGVKMTVAHWVHIPTLVSLAVIISAIAIAVIASLKRPLPAAATTATIEASSVEQPSVERLAAAGSAVELSAAELVPEPPIPAGRDEAAR